MRLTFVVLKTGLLLSACDVKLWFVFVRQLLNKGFWKKWIATVDRTGLMHLSQ